MKINEIVSKAQQNKRMLPSVVKHHAKVGKFVVQIAACDQQQASKARCGIPDELYDNV